MAKYSTCIKQSSANQLVFPLSVDPLDYDLLTFGFYQDGRCIELYTSNDKEYIDLTNEGEVRIYMIASVAKHFNPSRVSYEVTTWKDSTSELVVGCSFTLDVIKSNDRTSIVDKDDSEITDSRLKAQIERLVGQIDIGSGFDVDANGFLYLAPTVITEDATEDTGS